MLMHNTPENLNMKSKNASMIEKSSKSMNEGVDDEEYIKN